MTVMPSTSGRRTTHPAVLLLVSGQQPGTPTRAF